MANPKPNPNPNTNPNPNPNTEANTNHNPSGVLLKMEVGIRKGAWRRFRRVSFGFVRFRSVSFGFVEKGNPPEGTLLIYDH